MQLISAILVLTLCWSAYASTPDLTFDEALKHAAVLADSWSEQQKLLYDMAERIKPDTLPKVDIIVDSVVVASENRSLATDLNDIDAKIMAEIYDEFRRAGEVDEDYFNTATDTITEGTRWTKSLLVHVW